ncbi:hypothetical protein GC096_03620 [Paenibacillus sp. LMG 31461]|uniref:Uncharacterized protein n=1 Tax=Paenibacillus plantarum TaxID=2654975 RepID=A0ABX1X3Z9_9BACL|nr:hypothetical protein [Paenibacillus plantarum]
MTTDQRERVVLVLVLVLVLALVLALALALALALVPALVPVPVPALGSIIQTPPHYLSRLPSYSENLFQITIQHNAVRIQLLSHMAKWLPHRIPII